MNPNRFVKWSRKKYTENQRLTALIFMGMFFLIIMPAILVWTSNIDKKLNIPKIIFEPYNLIIAVFLILIGLIFAFWSVQIEFTRGEGTPAPMMPTQKLIITGPFRYCRNPMTFGTICGYLGVVVLTGSLSSLMLFILLISVLLTYIKLAEEKELAIRFGQAYLDYKKKVPFIIPRITKQRDGSSVW